MSVVTAFRIFVFCFLISIFYFAFPGTNTAAL